MSKKNKPVSARFDELEKHALLELSKYLRRNLSDTLRFIVRERYDQLKAKDKRSRIRKEVSSL